MRTIDTSTLSYAYIDAAPLDIDWEAARGEDLEGLTIHLPEITADILDQYGDKPEAFDADDWLEDNITYHVDIHQRVKMDPLAAEAGYGDVDEWLARNWRTVLDADKITEIEAAMAEAKEQHDEEALEEAVEEFKRSDSFYEWHDSFQPIMNYLWPCEPRYGMADEDAATAIDQHAGATVLVTINSDQHNGLQGIALTGGGMDMSWDICAAYLCCGCIPPVRLLSGVPHFAGQKNSELTRAVLECMDLAADWLESKAKRIREYRADTEKHLSK